MRSANLLHIVEKGLFILLEYFPDGPDGSFINASFQKLFPFILGASVLSLANFSPPLQLSIFAVFLSA